MILSMSVRPPPPLPLPRYVFLHLLEHLSYRLAGHPYPRAGPRKLLINDSCHPCLLHCTVKISWLCASRLSPPPVRLAGPAHSHPGAQLRGLLQGWHLLPCVQAAFGTEHFVLLVQQGRHRQDLSTAKRSNYKAEAMPVLQRARRTLPLIRSLSGALEARFHSPKFCFLVHVSEQAWREGEHCGHCRTRPLHGLPPPSRRLWNWSGRADDLGICVDKAARCLGCSFHRCCCLGPASTLSV